MLQAAFRGDVVLKGSPEDFQLINSREYGASRTRLELAKQLGLDRALYSRKEPWVRDCLAMIVGRLLYAGSKLALSNQWKNTTLWEQCGTEGKVDVEAHCYQAMDRLLGAPERRPRYGSCWAAVRMRKAGRTTPSR